MCIDGCLEVYYVGLGVLICVVVGVVIVVLLVVCLSVVRWVLIVVR